MYKNKSIHKLRKANTKIIKRRNQTADAGRVKKGEGEEQLQPERRSQQPFIS